ncbi:MAG: DUF4230 domain-containing protein [Lachnospiraceae bacterium]|nr:DUF4230 domain-containing protein [Lachnospiraceae bacterium]
MRHIFSRRGGQSSSAEIEEEAFRQQENLRIRRWGMIALPLVCVVLFVFSIYCFLDAIAVGADAAMNAYESEKDEVAQEVYDVFYNQSYSAAEASHHVSNQVSISIGTLQEEEKLEVLRVSNVEYVISEEEDGEFIDNILSAVTGIFSDDDVVSWLEVPGDGVFTVDLKSAEFILDEERQYVLIRIPEPELSEFAIDYEGVEILYFDDAGLFKNSAKVGEDLAREQLQDAQLQMTQEIHENQRFYRSAQEAAEDLLISLVKELNPDFPDLTVEVEFID